MKIDEKANINRESLQNFWTTKEISTKFSGKMWLKFMLKVTKIQDFTLSWEDTFLEKLQGGRDQIDPPSPPSFFRVKKTLHHLWDSDAIWTRLMAELTKKFFLIKIVSYSRILWTNSIVWTTKEKIIQVLRKVCSVLEGFEDDECDEDINQNQQIFDFVDVPSFVSLFTGNPAEPLCFVKVTEKEIAIKDMKD